MNKSDLSVQVVCATYNQERFIADALDSFVKQKTSFKFNVLVGDDCSADQTAQIIDQYAEKYPDLIMRVPRTQHMGAAANILDLCSRCSAPYLAFCNGCDFWTDDHKLQLQFDYMESCQEASVCFTKTVFKGGHSYGMQSSSGEQNSASVLLPDSVLGYAPVSDLTLQQYLESFLRTGTYPGQFSSAFYRWNHSVIWPDWMMKGNDFDIFVLAIQADVNGLIHFISETTAFCRCCESDASDAASAEDENIGKIVEILEKYHHLYEYFNYGNIKKAIRSCAFKLSYEYFFPQDSAKAEKARIKKILSKKAKSDKNTILSIISRFWTNSFKKVWENLEFDGAYYLNQYKDVADAGVDPKEHYIQYGFGEGRRGHHQNVTFSSLFSYWFGALYPKKKNRWAFSGFHGRDNSFLDNTKYLFSYIVRHHPEIQAVWLAGSLSDLDKLKSEGLPAVLLRSKEGKSFLRSAALAVTDHYRCSDFQNIWGFNARTKVANLWHGVGLKSMVIKSGGRIASVVVPGARLSPDIIIEKTDSFATKIKKAVLYFFRAPFRELYEKYFFLLTPGPVIENFNAKLWRIPQKAIFQCGMPRCRYLYNAVLPDRPRVIYSPTFRWNAKDEETLVDNFINSIGLINDWLKKVDGTMTLRLHPHTWRSYGSKILKAIESFDRFIYDSEKDVYGSLEQYSIMISDYSSIVYDFLLMNRPVIFFNYDFETFCEHDVNFWYPFDEYSPGLKAKNWKEVIECLDVYSKMPQKDNEWRDRIMSVQYYKEKNNRDNSERIVSELKRRLGI